VKSDPIGSGFTLRLFVLSEASSIKQFHLIGKRSGFPAAHDMLPEGRGRLSCVFFFVWQDFCCSPQVS
jgi:hypothetical protein